MAAMAWRGGAGGGAGGGLGRGVGGEALSVARRGLLSVLSSAEGTNSTCGNFNFEAATVREAMWTWRQTVRIFEKAGTGNSGGQEKVGGRMEYDIMSWSSLVRLKDDKGETIATSRHEMRTGAGELFPHDVIVVEDCAGNQLGEVTEELQSAGMGSVVLFTFADAQGKVFASSSPKGDGMVVHDVASGKSMVTLMRTTTFGDLRDSWTMSRSNSNGRALDARLLLLAIAAQSPPVAWGLSAFPFILFLVLSLLVACLLCVRFCMNNRGYTSIENLDRTEYV
ncbi:hypothetical protein GUITHDRAFT_144341 [Guillardia theta CCMP2712]|uniref:Uncharacterized protein n=1 Tax=Guillardia theta (strain CCMP2712) TaxID=905079 RepID=L1IPN8_GUITC|nr:hypothetical protein GUITHDRAFT_144341 [Guillardia theta CCMP2712]EKX38223.1 hypothetical protein GUITHDRAFT_144341 [Guillardia theta CCMP2712]|eukprot:XP_005825203.1 hypothetical protein GUITHDRAFT_144341 [Guillardia theta CCMP2712]